jgi:hypothetical protein
MVERMPKDADSKSAMKWVVGALRSLQDRTVHRASYVCEKVRNSAHYVDPFFDNGWMSPLDLEDGMILYTHRWDGAPIAMIKTDYMAQYLNVVHNLSSGKSGFICRHFRIFTTMRDGITHVFLRPVVVTDKKWWVWSANAAGWFSCLPPPSEKRSEALRTGVFDVNLTPIVEFIAFSEFMRRPMDIEKDIRLTMGAAMELDPFTDEVVIRKPPAADAKVVVTPLEDKTIQPLVGAVAPIGGGRIPDSRRIDAVGPFKGGVPPIRRV